MLIAMADDFASASGSDVVWGADGIGAFLGLSERQVYHLAATGTLPIGKLGNRLFALRQSLIDYLRGLTSGPGGEQ
jgi:hypothetical protein